MFVLVGSTASERCRLPWPPGWMPTVPGASGVEGRSIEVHVPPALAEWNTPRSVPRAIATTTTLPGAIANRTLSPDELIGSNSASMVGVLIFVQVAPVSALR